MSNLKQVIKNALEITQKVSPEILSKLDPLIGRSLVRLQSRDLLPPRTLEFKSAERKQVMYDGDDKLFNYYYLPEDYRKLDEFRPLKTYPYEWESDEYALYEQNIPKGRNKDTARRRFTIINNNFDEESKYEKILIASPFPDDDETVQLKYYINGQSLNWDWVTADYHEAIITDIEKMIGLRSAQDQEAEERISEAVERHKELKSTGKVGHLKGTFFGKRGRNISYNNFGKRNN